MSMQQEQLLNV